MLVWLLLSLTGLLVEAATIALLSISGAAMESSVDAIVTAWEYNAITLILSIVLQAGLVVVASQDSLWKTSDHVSNWEPIRLE